MKGTVKWYNMGKHIGFIVDEEGHDRFFHLHEIKKGRTYVGLETGDEVEFIPSDAEKGPIATQVCITKLAPKPQIVRHDYYPKDEPQ